MNMLQIMKAAKRLAEDDGRDWELLRAEVMDQYIDLAIAQWKSTSDTSGAAGEGSNG